MNSRVFALLALALAATPTLADEPFKYTNDQKDACFQTCVNTART